MSKQNKKWKRFLYAWSGITAAVKEEVHMRVHLVSAAVVIVLGIAFEVSKWEWLVLLLTIGFVIGLEMVNTAIERVVDLTTTEIHPLAKAAKDIAAGAVLVSAAMAAVIGLIIFVPYIMR